MAARKPVDAGVKDARVGSPTHGGVLECRDLHKRFGDVEAVRGVSLQIAAGETYGLLGPNGAGKTTTISMACGLLEADRGEVILAGRPLTTRSVAAKAAIGYVPQELAIYPDAAEALGRLKQAGYLLIVVTNQPDIARGTATRATVDGINAAIGAALPIGEFLVCAHDDAANCPCRKPKPGMVLEAAARHAIDLKQSFLIGDRWRDIDCGASAGVRTVLIDRGYGERAPEHAPDFVTESLGAAADWILRVFPA